MTYVLHYAPDNASLVVRMALDHAGLPFEARLVDRSVGAQRAAPYLKLNPHGLIPALETTDGVLFETAAILLWLADRHGGLGPGPDDPSRGDFLKWLFYLSNTLHPALRTLFYPGQYVDRAAEATLQKGAEEQLLRAFAKLETLAGSAPPWLGAEAPTVVDFYLAAILRWPAIYPQNRDRNWYRLPDFPALFALCERVEALDCTQRLKRAEGMGTWPFTAPAPPTPPEGTAI